MERFLVVLALIIVSFLTSHFLLLDTQVVAAEEKTTPEEQTVVPITQPIKTQSRFETKLLTDKTTLPKETIYKDDPETEAGEEQVLEEGTDGSKTVTTKVSYYEGEEFSEELVSTEIIKPTDKVILRGTKIIWRTLPTPEGEIRYWKKMRVYATHYDSRCAGCNETTAIGMRAGKGVIAVDPKVIKMRSQVYIPGYGKAVAGDTGGAIKGKIIDLGFEDARTAGWRAQYVDIYLL